MRAIIRRWLSARVSAENPCERDSALSAARYPEQSEQVRQVIEDGVCCTYGEILAEVVYALDGVYNVERARIANELLVFINKISVYDRAVLKMALRLYGESSLDFVDCLLISRNSLDRVRVVTFDKQLSKRLADW